LFFGSIPPDAFAEKGGNNKAQGNPQSCDKKKNPEKNPNCEQEPVPEICDDGIDNDLDGLVDEADPDCASPPPEPTADNLPQNTEICFNGSFFGALLDGICVNICDDGDETTFDILRPITGATDFPFFTCDNT